MPSGFWSAFFLTSHPTIGKIWGPVAGPLIAIVSFVCSVGNIPLAAVLWNGGISFGGVVAFIFADLIVLPVLNIYRKYYGGRVAVFLLATFYAAMAGAALMIEFLFQALGLVPTHRTATVAGTTITLNYTSVLNVVFLLLASVLVVRFLMTGGPRMLRMMDAPRPEVHGDTVRSGDGDWVVSNSIHVVRVADISPEHPNDSAANRLRRVPLARDCAPFSCVCRVRSIPP